MKKKIFSAAFAACVTSPLVIMPTTALVSAISIVSPIATHTAHAGAFPGWGQIIGDTLPCQPSLSHMKNSCILLHERINLFQGLRGSKPALQYCQEKYGSNATVVWRLGLRWCATPDMV
jgi:hypothetical protein